MCKYTGGGGDSYCCLPAQYVYGFTGECKWCPLDTYNSVLSDMETCTACPHFSGNTGGNSDGVGASISTCRCKEGYTGAGGAECTQCAAGKYKTATGSSDCAHCAAGKTSPLASEESTACTCLPGHSITGLTCSHVCDDGKRIGEEACDDGNLVSGDGCSVGCSV